MPAYQKICIICSKNFYTQRLNTLYCGRQCRNRSRYLPPNLLASLTRRNSQWAIEAVANKYSGMMVEDNGRMNPHGYNKDAFSDTDIEAYEKSIRLGLDPKVKLSNYQHESVKVENKSIPSDVPIDNEMLEMNLKLGRDIEFTAKIDNSLPDPDDDGLSNRPEIVQKPPKRTFGGGIKK